ncbi:SH3 domain-containing protein [Bacillus salipaludis]|uniref:SH3 domain-containing protein n=1 Tax=Bacillus salipaludis TaxID=2547811 RepID=A0ABW8RPC9_9BACI
MQTYTVIKDYQSCYPDPIVLKKGEEIFYGKEDTQYPNWIFCKSIISKKEGWVPKQILSSPDVSSKAIVLQDYSAHELTVNKGELLVGLKHLNGWTYCKTKTEEHGWIPTEHLFLISK